MFVVPVVAISIAGCQQKPAGGTNAFPLGKSPVWGHAGRSHCSVRRLALLPLDAMSRPAWCRNFLGRVQAASSKNRRFPLQAQALAARPRESLPFFRSPFRPRRADL
jgi:hypothetical protein